MSSKDNNLSSSTDHEIQSAKGFKIGIVVSEWNEDITFSLRDAAIETLKKYEVSEEDIFVKYVPGAYEMPMGARLMMKKEFLDAVICLGCVIKGETAHDIYINQAVASGIMQLGLTSGTPVIFGLLTPNDKQQAIDRAGGKYGNKGVEAATTAIKMIHFAKDTKDTKKSIGF